MIKTGGKTVSYNSLYSKKTSKSVKVYDFDTITENLTSENTKKKASAADVRPVRGRQPNQRPNGATGRENTAPSGYINADMYKSRTQTSAPKADARGNAVQKNSRARRTVPQASQIRIHTVKATKRNPFPTAVVFMSIISTVLFMYLIFNMVQINEATQDISQMQNRLVEMKEESKELTLELEKKNDLKAIEDYAVNVLGMVKMDQLPKKYVSVDNEEKVEVVKPEPEDTTGPVSTIMSAISENFSSFFGIN